MEAKALSDSQPSISIPVIDLSGVNSPSDRPKIVDQVKQAAKEWGFFQVINHGIPLSVQNDTVSAVNAFFDLPSDAKSEYRNPHGVMHSSSNDSSAAAASSWRETVRIMAMPELPPEEEFPEVFRREVGAWVRRATGVGEAVMELLAEGLGLESGRLKELSFSEGKVFLGHCYPHCPERDRTVGLTSHTDGGVLTVLMQNQVPGLQVMHQDYGWVDVKPERGGFIVNIGDLFQVVSNDEYKSVQHRVLANPLKESRISIVIVFNPMKWRDDGCFGPLPELLSPEKPAVYRDFTKEEFMNTFRNKAIGNKSLVERVKI